MFVAVDNNCIVNVLLIKGKKIRLVNLSQSHRSSDLW